MVFLLIWVRSLFIYLFCLALLWCISIIYHESQIFSVFIHGSYSFASWVTSQQLLFKYLFLILIILCILDLQGRWHHFITHQAILIFNTFSFSYCYLCSKEINQDIQIFVFCEWFSKFRLYQVLKSFIGDHRRYREEWSKILLSIDLMPMFTKSSPQTNNGCVQVIFCLKEQVALFWPF
jgi:hypothetical protein